MQFVVMLCIHGKDQQVQSESSKDFFFMCRFEAQSKSSFRKSSVDNEMTTAVIRWHHDNPEMSCVLSDITSDPKPCHQPQDCAHPSEAGQPRRSTGEIQWFPHSGCHTTAAQLIPAHAESSASSYVFAPSSSCSLLWKRAAFACGSLKWLQSHLDYNKSRNILKWVLCNSDKDIRRNNYSPSKFISFTYCNFLHSSHGWCHSWIWEHSTDRIKPDSKF